MFNKILPFTIVICFFACSSEVDMEKAKKSLANDFLEFIDARENQSVNSFLQYLPNELLDTVSNENLLTRLNVAIEARKMISYGTSLTIDTIIYRNSALYATLIIEAEIEQDLSHHKASSSTFALTNSIKLAIAERGEDKVKFDSISWILKMKIEQKLFARKIGKETWKFYESNSNWKTVYPSLYN